MARKYTAIVKTGTLPDGSNICVKYRFNNINNFLNFIQAKYPNVKWANIYNKETKQLIYTWGNKKGLCDATNTGISLPKKFEI